MIHESGGVTPQLNNERVYRGNQAAPDRAAEQEAENPHSELFDRISLSAEALALAKNGTPVSEGSEQGQGEAVGRGQGEDRAAGGILLDIRA
ncbi:MAG: hypothetical protein ACN4GW_10000 [Desulforhopalus sp.]